MKQEDFLILLLALLLLLAMLLTYVFRGERSMHGYGASLCRPGVERSVAVRMKGFFEPVGIGSRIPG